MAPQSGYVLGAGLTLSEADIERGDHKPEDAPQHLKVVSGGRDNDDVWSDETYGAPIPDPSQVQSLSPGSKNHEPNDAPLLLSLPPAPQMLGKMVPYSTPSPRSSQSTPASRFWPSHSGEVSPTPSAQRKTSPTPPTPPTPPVAVAGDRGAGAGARSPCALHDAVQASDAIEVVRLLKGNADPNAALGGFEFEGRRFKSGSPLALAAMRGSAEVMRALVRHGADIESSYSFLAGSLGLRWIGPASFATVPRGNLSMLRELLALRANPHATNSSGANLLWQACYFGETAIVEELLALRADMGVIAQSHDDARHQHTPLHVAAWKGHVLSVQALLAARADAQAASANGLVPLGDAIECGHAEVVRLLVASGAGLLESGPRRETCSGRRFRRGFDLLFEFNNARIITAAARGLADAPREVEQYLSQVDLLGFLSSGGRAPIHIINAIFRERPLKYRDEVSGRLVKVRTAVLREGSSWGTASGGLLTPAAWLRLVGATTGPHHRAVGESLGDLGRSRELVSFLRSLAPQGSGRGGYGEVPVDILQCLLPGLYDDASVLLALALASGDAGSVHDEPACQGLVAVAWARARIYAFGLIALQVAHLVELCVISLRLGGGKRDIGASVSAWPADLIAWAWVLGSLCFFEIILHTLAVVGYVLEGVTVHAIRLPGSWTDMVNVLITLLILITAFVQTRGAEVAFIVFVIISLLTRWTRAVWLACSVECLGFYVLPLLEAVTDYSVVLPPFIVMICCALVSAQVAYILEVDPTQSVTYWGISPPAAMILAGVGLVVFVALAALLLSRLSARYALARDGVAAQFWRQRGCLAANCAAIQGSIAYITGQRDRRWPQAQGGIRGASAYAWYSRRSLVEPSVNALHAKGEEGEDAATDGTTTEALTLLRKESMARASELAASIQAISVQVESLSSQAAKAAEAMASPTRVGSSPRLILPLEAVQEGQQFVHPSTSLPGRRRQSGSRPQRARRPWPAYASQDEDASAGGRQVHQALLPDRRGSQTDYGDWRDDLTSSEPV